MKKNIIHLTIAGLFALALIATPFAARAADDATMAPDQTAPAAPKKNGTIPFHGKLASVDKDAMTLMVGTRTFTVTSTTKITKDGKPATLADAVVGENVAGAYKKGDDGKLNVSTLKLNVKAKKKKDAAE